MAREVNGEVDNFHKETTMSATEKKLAELNSMYVIIREWQSGAINQREMNFRLASHLTQTQLDALSPRLYRTIDKVALAKAIADVIGL